MMFKKSIKIFTNSYHLNVYKTNKYFNKLLVKTTKALNSIIKF